MTEARKVVLTDSGGLTGGDDGLGCPLHHAAGEHRAADHRGSGYEHHSRHRYRTRIACVFRRTSWRPVARPDASRICGMAGHRRTHRSMMLRAWHRLRALKYGGGELKHMTGNPINAMSGRCRRLFPGLGVRKVRYARQDRVGQTGMSGSNANVDRILGLFDDERYQGHVLHAGVDGRTLSADLVRQYGRLTVTNWPVTAGRMFVSRSRTPNRVSR